MDRGKRQLDLGCQRHSDLLRLSGYSRHQKRHSTRAATARHKPSPHRNAAFAGLDNGLDDRTRKEPIARIRYRAAWTLRASLPRLPRGSVEGATLQHSTTPSLRPQGVEHSLSDEARAQCCQPLEVGLASEARSTTGGGEVGSTTTKPLVQQDDAICCPRCGSSDTRVVSQFGSTPCKAFYICNSCLEPFDYFKCH